ncbi:MAG: class I SAM-dependent methyltransferase [Pseudomonadota bacterium]
MTPEARAAFFTVHRDLPREGPGQPEDVRWALTQVPTPARVLDAGCGPGADTVTLAKALPDARIEAIEVVEHFAAAAARRTERFGPRVTAAVGDMQAPPNPPYDLIWCAGALYFLGVTEGLTLWRDLLVPGGHVAFSEPIWLRTPPGPAETAFWADYAAITDRAGLEDRIDAAGYRVVAHRDIVGASWAAYYDPMQARIDMLRASEPDAALTAALDENQTEIDRWRAAPDRIAYALYVVTPT